MPTPASRPKTVPSLVDARAAFDRHAAAWRAAGDDPRAQARTAKAAAHAARQLFEAGEREPEQLTRLVEVVETATKVHSFPGPWRAVAAKMRQAWRSASGAPPLAVLSTASAQIALEGALLSLGDASALARVAGQAPDERLMRAGQVAYVGTGADGEVRVTVRVVSGDEPMLGDGEQRRATGATGLVILDVPTGTLACAAAGDASPALSVTVTPGHHAARCFLVRDEYIWVVAATTRPLGEAPATIDVLETE